MLNPKEKTTMHATDSKPLSDTSTPQAASLPVQDGAVLSPVTRRTLLRTMAAAVLAAAVGGCGKSRAGASDTPPLVVVTPIDISASTAAGEVHGRYFRDFQTVVDGMGTGDFLGGYPITGDTMSTSADRIAVSFPAYSPFSGDNYDAFQAKLAQARADAISEARALLTKLGTALASDILNAFQDAADTFNGGACRACPDKRLVVFSDLVHQAGDYDFLREDLTARRAAEIIASQRAAGLLPALGGVRVWVAGATASPSYVTPEQIAQIRRFWIGFFAACGADLTLETYGTVLQNYPAGS
jgi:hypothetical protein